MIEARPAPTRKSRSVSWRSREGRSLIYQVLAIGSVIALIALLVRNTLANMKARGIQSGYDFLNQPFGFDVSETLIPYDMMSSYWTAFAIGMTNTLRVAVIGIVLATLLGTPMPDAGTVGLAAAAALLVLATGLDAIRRLEPRMADLV